MYPPEYQPILVVQCKLYIDLNTSSAKLLFCTSKLHKLHCSSFQIKGRLQICLYKVKYIGIVS